MRTLAERLLAALVSGFVPLLVAMKVRVYQANIHRIGDSLIDVGFYAKARALGWRGTERPIVIPGPSEKGKPGPQYPANSCALEYLARTVRISTSRLLFPLLFRLRLDPRIGGELFGDLPLPDGRRVDQYLFAMAVQKHWEDEGRAPLLQLREEHRERGVAELRSLGLGDDDWFVCVHVREAGFLRGEASAHRHLNADIDTYLLAIESITARGGWIVRMGDPSMKPLPTHERVVDYAHSSIKSEWMDVFLAASCRFWLGTNSGLFMLASSFGVPCALTNVAPMTFRPWSYGDVFVPKLYRASGGARLLSFAEGLASDLYTSHDIDRLGLEPVDNDADDIADLADEMLARLDGVVRYDVGDEELQRRFNSLTAEYYPYGVTSRIGRAFVHKHEDLL